MRLSVPLPVLLSLLCAGALAAAEPAPGTSATAPAHAPPPPLPGDAAYNCPRFIAVVEDGRLYVFHAGAKELKEFAKTHRLDMVTERIHGGPRGMTIIAPNEDTLEGYLKAYAERCAEGSAPATGAAPAGHAGASATTSSMKQ
jgi:hypothetical protein